MKDAGGTIWHMLRLSEHDRDALAITRRLVMRELRGNPDSDAWRNGAGAVEPEAVLINLDRMIEDWGQGGGVRMKANPTGCHATRTGRRERSSGERWSGHWRSSRHS
jgi:hypothetical protein